MRGKNSFPLLSVTLQNSKLVTGLFTYKKKLATVRFKDILAPNCNFLHVGNEKNLKKILNKVIALLYGPVSIAPLRSNLFTKWKCNRQLDMSRTWTMGQVQKVTYQGAKLGKQGPHPQGNHLSSPNISPVMCLV